MNQKDKDILLNLMILSVILLLFIIVVQTMNFAVWIKTVSSYGELLSNNQRIMSLIGVIGALMASIALFAIAYNIVSFLIDKYELKNDLIKILSNRTEKIQDYNEDSEILTKFAKRVGLYVIVFTISEFFNEKNLVEKTIKNAYNQNFLTQLISSPKLNEEEAQDRINILNNVKILKVFFIAAFTFSVALSTTFIVANILSLGKAIPTKVSLVCDKLFAWSPLITIGLTIVAAISALIFTPRSKLEDPTIDEKRKLSVPLFG